MGWIREKQWKMRGLFPNSSQAIIKWVCPSCAHEYAFSYDERGQEMTDLGEVDPIFSSNYINRVLPHVNKRLAQDGLKLEVVEL